MVQNNINKERCVYAIVSTFFGLSYVGRYVINIYFYGENCRLSVFGEEMLFMMVYILEGASMGVVMMLHYLNFKKDD